MTAFAWQPATYAETMTGLSLATAQGARPVTLPGAMLSHGLMGTCVSAELLAAQAGLVPFVTLTDGTKGVANVGGAREAVEAAGYDKASVRALYLGTHGGVRRVHATVKRAAPDAPLTFGAAHAGAPNIGFIPIAVYLTVVGVAAIVAGAWYASSTAAARATVDGENARQLARIDAASKLAMTELQTTGRVSRDTWDFLKHEADAEASKASLLGKVPPAALLGGAAALGLGAYAWWKLR